jgi:transcriptional regulator with XRE-family HTH domain
VAIDPVSKTQLRKLGRAVRTLRLASGFSQERFAEVCEVHRTHMGEIERGEVNLSWDSFSRMARGLRVKPSEVLERAGL